MVGAIGRGKASMKLAQFCLLRNGFNQEGVRGESGLNVAQLPGPLRPAVNKTEMFMSCSAFINHTKSLKWKIEKWYSLSVPTE